MHGGVFFVGHGAGDQRERVRSGRDSAKSDAYTDSNAYSNDIAVCDWGGDLDASTSERLERGHEQQRRDYARRNSTERCGRHRASWSGE